MADIHELSAILADQIAAGEVIERPASVVKELVENAIDANASKIDILVEEAGIKTITVIDDGDGIEAGQVTRAFLRHATSKITDRNDLFRVHSLGFRGEALPSIASVADVLLKTATAEAEQGKLVHYRGGSLLEESGTDARKGTSITVKDLFFNTPARLKYLKSQQTELAQIVDIINRLALSYPEIAFRLVHNDKAVTSSVGNGNIQQVLAAIYGVQQARKMLAIQAEDADFKVTGYVSLPELTRASRSYISVLINGRYIKNYQLTKALIKGYGSKLMVGRFPMAVLAIEMDPLLVDVNVHPQKQEVRLSKETQLMDLIETAVKERLQTENLIPNAYDNYMGAKQGAQDGADQPFIMQLNDISRQRQAASVSPTTELKPASTKMNDDTNGQERLADVDVTEFADLAHKPLEIHAEADLQASELQAFAARYAHSEDLTPFNEGGTPFAGSQAQLDFDKQSKHDGQERFPLLSYIGQMHGTFLFAQAEDGLYLVDQHAAQERVKYEYYRDEIGRQGQELQQFLVPIILEYAPVDIIKIQAHQAELNAVGINLEPFDDKSLIIREHPAWFIAGQEESTVREMVDWVLREGQMTVADFRERTAIMMACKRSIKANHALNDFEARGLLEQLAKSENPFNCPHGRPVVVTFSLIDMEKMFKRIQDSHDSWVEYDNHPF